MPVNAAAGQPGARWRSGRTPRPVYLCIRLHRGGRDDGAIRPGHRIRGRV